MPSLSGSFLVASPKLHDPNFRQAVVLLLKHGEGGTFGLVVNRPGGVTPESRLPIFRGGPCPGPGLILLHGHPDWASTAADLGEEGEADRDLAPGIFLGDADCLKRVLEAGPDEAYRFRVFGGYAGWGPGQLEGELAHGAWAVVPATGELLFDVPAEELWANLCPPSYPQPSVN
jgi:putative transcriptional regulator